MKDQYFGDVNDYRKYGLLHVLAEVSGLSVGVCWMLTAPDDSADGAKRKYLQAREMWRHFDPDLFDHLKQAEEGGEPRAVCRYEQCGLLPNARFYSALLQDPAEDRQRYFEACFAEFESCDVVFFDPDNGVEVKSVTYGGKRSSKFVFWRELAATYENGKSLIVYQHFPRIERRRFIASLVDETRARLNSRHIDTFSTPHVLFLFVVQPHHLALFADVHSCLQARWKGEITPQAHWDSA